MIIYKTLWCILRESRNNSLSHIHLTLPHKLCSGVSAGGASIRRLTLQDTFASALSSYRSFLLVLNTPSSAAQCEEWLFLFCNVVRSRFCFPDVFNSQVVSLEWLETPLTCFVRLQNNRECKTPVPSVAHGL